MDYLQQQDRLLQEEKQKRLAMDDVVGESPMKKQKRHHQRSPIGPTGPTPKKSPAIVDKPSIGPSLPPVGPSVPTSPGATKATTIDDKPVSSSLIGPALPSPSSSTMGPALTPSSSESSDETKTCTKDSKTTDEVVGPELPSGFIPSQAEE
jgi:hypothetical protein